MSGVTDPASKATRAVGLLRKALNQWLDGDDERASRPLFVVGCQRSGTTMLIDHLMRAPQLWTHPEKSQLAYEDFRLRSPATVDWILTLTPADTVVFKPLCDSHLTDRLLDEHEGARAIWLYRSWRDVARSAVAKWGDHQKQVILDLAAGRWDAIGWRGERVPPALVQQLRELADPEMTPETGAALFWYLRNSFFHALDLDADRRVLLVRYEDLVQRPGEAFPAVFAHVEAPFDAAWIADVEDRSGRGAAEVDVPTEVAALCDALTERLDDALRDQAARD